jgi:hypothetical protein
MSNWGLPGRSLGEKSRVGGNLLPRLLALTIAVVALLASAGSAAPIAPQGTLTAPGASAGDYLGESVAISGDTAIVGARGRDVGGHTGAGAAFVFTRTAGVWSLQQTLTADVPANNDGFGIAVAVSGDTALVGSQADFVTIFTRTAGVWTQSQELTSTMPGDNYGQAVALQGDTALVGAIYHGTPGKYAGSVFAYTRTAGVFGGSQELTGTDVINAEYFGSSCAVDGDVAVVGAQRHNHTYDGSPAGAGSGGAFVFTRTAGVWSPSQELTITTSYSYPIDYLNTNDNFGNAVAVSGDTAIVGARSHDYNGAAYVFKQSSGVWTQQQRLTALDGANADSLGSSVALDGDTGLIGSPGHQHSGGIKSGACYVFSRSGSTWAEAGEFSATGLAASDGFGKSAVLSADSALVGAYGHAVGGASQAGSAYVFLRSGLESLVDTTPPAPPAGLKGVAGYRKATLTWTNPSPDYTGTFIYHSTTRYASSATDTVGQSTMYWGKATKFVDTPLTSGKRYYFTLFDKDDSNNWSTGARVSVVPQSYPVLGAPSLKPASPTHGKKFKVSGTLSPKHASKATVKLCFYRKVGSTYKPYKTVNVTAAANRTAYSTYVTLAAKGKFYVKSYHADAAHAAKYSSIRSFTVK